MTVLNNAESKQKNATMLVHVVLSVQTGARAITSAMRLTIRPLSSCPILLMFNLPGFSNGSSLSKTWKLKTSTDGLLFFKTMNILDSRGPAMDGLSGCQAVYNGNLFVLGGDGSNTVWRVSDCGLVEAQWSLPTEWENPGDKEDVAALEWNGGHVCQNANHLKEEDKDGLMICGPSSRTKVCLFFTQDEDGNFDWRNYPETPEGHNRGALADNRYQGRK